MKKWSLILFIAFWLLLMLAFSGGYDSHTTAVAWHHHHEARSEMTLKELQAAKRSDRWHILFYEMILGAALIWPVIALIRLSRKES
jgi:hypothetical protein